MSFLFQLGFPGLVLIWSSLGRGYFVVGTEHSQDYSWKLVENSFRGLYYTTFYECNLRIFVIGQRDCPW